VAQAVPLESERSHQQNEGEEDDRDKDEARILASEAKAQSSCLDNVSWLGRRASATGDGILCPTRRKAEPNASKGRVHKVTATEEKVRWLG
jgi:hypothetical protein